MLNLLTSIKVDESNQTSEDRPILIIDVLNLFIRNYHANPSMTSQGEQFGGVVGFLKKMQTLIEEFQPKFVCVVWESGGSQKRRRLYADYKNGSRPADLNRFYGDDIPDSEQNKTYQMCSLLELLKHTPVCQLYTKNCEADDVIAFLCKSKFKDQQKIIVSSDKDMFQLLDKSTSMYSLQEKKILTVEDVWDKYHIMPWNFALAKALCGDDSDNIPGLKGFGFKTAIKKIPLLSTHNDLILQDIFDFCQTNINESVHLKRVIDEMDRVKLNWQLVYLDVSSLSATQANYINSSIDTFAPKVGRMLFTKALIKEGLMSFDVASFMYCFTCIENLNMSYYSSTE